MIKHLSFAHSLILEFYTKKITLIYFSSTYHEWIIYIKAFLLNSYTPKNYKKFYQH